MFISFLFPVICAGQEYVNIFKLGYGQTLKNKFKEVDASTTVTSFDSGLTLPIQINTAQAVITGFDFSYSRLQLFPDAEFTNLFSTTMPLGLASKWSDKWSTTFVLLPKMASDYRNISSNDFYLGALALLKLKKNENLLFRFGFYGSQESFGLFTTPIIGWYYKSSNNRFEMDMSLPIAADINYKLGNTTLGMDYFGIGRSYNVHYANAPTLYADLSSLEFATYIQFNLAKESVLLKTKLGYSSNDYQMYAQGDKMELGVSAFSFGDDRTQLNPSLRGSVFVRLEFIYRYHFHKSISDER